MRPPVLVTGATGFLGRAVTRSLAEAGHAVHAIARPESDRAQLAGLAVRWHEGDVTDPDSLVAAARAVGAGGLLVHGAAAIGYRTGDAELQRAVNLEGTRKVLDAAASAGLARAVHVSSIVAVARAVGDEAVDERSEWNAASLGDYAVTKRAAEEEALARTDLEVSAVCPGAIFGPDPRANTSRFLLRLAAGRLPVVGPGGLSVVGVEDVARGVLLALERGEAGRRYLLVERYLPLRALCRMAATELATMDRGVRVPLAAPDWLWPAVVGVARLADRVRPLEEATPQALAMLGARWRARADRARAELGWRPQPFEEVLRATLEELLAPAAVTAARRE